MDHPRWLYVLPSGGVLVAETNAPPKSGDGRGIKGWIMGLVMKQAAAATPSANRITLLRDTDGDGIANVRTTLLEGLNSPFGMALCWSPTTWEMWCGGSQRYDAVLPCRLKPIFRALCRKSLT